MDAIVEHCPPRRSWLQFSLRGMLLLVVVAAIGLSVWTSNQRLRENRRLQGEIKRLKSELGELTIEEGQEGKVHAIGVPHVESLVWKWRIYVPAGKNFYLRTRDGAIPAGEQMGELANRSSSCNLSQGEQIVTVALRRNHKDEWSWIVKRASGDLSNGVCPEVREMVDEGNYHTSSSGVERQQEVMKPGAKLELLRLEMWPDRSNTAKPKPGGGIVVFVSE